MKLKYVSIIVENLEESKKFYKNNFNLEIIEEFKIPEQMSMAMLTDGNNVIELIENNTESKISGIGFEVENINESIKKLEEKNIKISHKPLNEEDLKVAVLTDPNGVEISLSQKED